MKNLDACTPPPSRKIGFACLLSIALCLSGWARAADLEAMNADVRHLDDGWAHIKYEVKDRDERIKDLDALATEANSTVSRYPGQVKPLLWDGIIASEQAAVAPIIHKLGFASTARKLFERAEASGGSGPDGAVAMCLGVIYYKVPRFPMGFGDVDKARHYLETALAKDPNGLDANFFYGDFLIKRGEKDKARTVLTHALSAPQDPNRPVWDAGRRAEIRALLAKFDNRSGA
jgi:tetratricopeptide (TPR) repeat protein